MVARRPPFVLRLAPDRSAGSESDRAALRAGGARLAAYDSGTFPSALVPDDIKGPAGWKVNEFFPWGSVPCGTANVESGGRVRHKNPPRVNTQRSAILTRFP